MDATRESWMVLGIAACLLVLVLLVFPSPSDERQVSCCAPVPLPCEVVSVSELDLQEVPIQLQLEAAGAAEFNRACAVVCRAMEKYSERALRGGPELIVIARSMTLSSCRVAGTYFGPTIYIALEGAHGVYSDVGLESTLHSEVSSVMLYSGLGVFPFREWKRCNPGGFEYSGSGLDAVRQGAADSRWRRDWHVLGFVNEYATASIEEDVNEVVGNMMTGTPGFWELVDAYPGLARKAKLAAMFLRRVDPAFSMEVVRGFRPVGQDSGAGNQAR